MTIKIQIDSKEDRKKFYDEFFYIRGRYHSIIKKPSQKVEGLTKSIKRSILITIIVFVITLFGFWVGVSYYLSILCFISLFITLACLYFANKSLKTSIEEKSGSTINIDEHGIELVKKDNFTAKIEWPMIDKIIINHYSICVFPKQVTSLMIAVTSQYKKEFLEAMKQYQKEHLIIDNSHLYK